MMIVLDFKEMEMPKARPSDEYLILREVILLALKHFCNRLRLGIDMKLMIDIAYMSADG
jgi:hypothetical protein